MCLHRSDLNIAATCRQICWRFQIRNANNTWRISKFTVIFHWLQWNLLSFTHIFLKMPTNLKRCNLSKFLDFNLILIYLYHDYTWYAFEFRLKFRFNFHRAAPPRLGEQNVDNNNWRAARIRYRHLDSHEISWIARASRKNARPLSINISSGGGQKAQFNKTGGKTDDLENQRWRNAPYWTDHAWSWWLSAAQRQALASQLYR